MAKIDKEYHNLLKNILDNGFKYEDSNRKGINRIQIPSYQFKHDFKDGFPAITTKKLYWKGIVGELLWFLRGDTNIKYLVDNGINIWNKDAYNWYQKKSSNKLSNGFSIKQLINSIKNDDKPSKVLGDLGRIYGAQWRDWYESDMFGKLHSTDQISNLIKGLKENPMGTRHIVTAWNPAELDNIALPPCHWSFEILVEPFYKECEETDYWYSDKQGCGCSELGVANCIGNYNQKYQFTLKWHQRSVDTFLGLPFNIASYALLAHIIGKMTNMIPKGIIGDLSNVHIYEPHLDAVKEQLSRDVYKYSKCELNISEGFLGESNLFSKGQYFTLDRLLERTEINDFKLKDYNSYPSIKAEMLTYNK